ncbi:MAG: hypothetical protein CME91_09660 [Hyphomonadaceae bacterium]|jgi:hypothetical protein|nr:hypothetical protein [Hyphomonadaceae bacterium]MBA28185.1 hypothetical protein [Hyphomonadaceae bacterium]|tara:strand:- start:107 stop:442 length:336 start_codon:yes stop_codon:yes gene_type:complete
MLALMTEFTHYTLIADGHVFEPNAEYATDIGPCIMGMKVWAADADQAADMIVVIGKRLGFKADGELQVFVTEGEVPAEDQPFGYDVQFTTYSDIEDEDGDGMEDDSPKWIH